MWIENVKYSKLHNYLPIPILTHSVNSVSKDNLSLKSLSWSTSDHGKKKRRNKVIIDNIVNINVGEHHQHHQSPTPKNSQLHYFM